MIYRVGALAAAALLLSSEIGLASTAELTIRNVTVVDPVEGVQGERDVHIDDGRIVSIDAPGSAPGGQVVDGTGKFLIPGLWDMHGHVSDEASGPLYVLNGVTGVRQMGGHSASYAWRHRGLEASPAMPRMYLGSPLVDGSPAHVPGSIEIGTPDEARAVVRIIKTSGADFIKVYSKVPAPAYGALIDEASKLGVRVEGHVPDAVSWAEVATKGEQRSIEHLWGLPRWVAENAEDLSARTAKFYESVTWGGTLTPDQQARTIELQNEAYDKYAPARFAALVRDLASNRVWQTPTLIVWETRIREADPANASDPRLDLVPGWMRDFWKGKVAVDGNDKPAAKALSERRHRFNLDRLREMHRAGVPILAGSDAPLPYVFPGWGVHDELKLLVEAGLTPIEALRAATSNAGQFIGRKEIGRISEGALADLVILTADPTKDIGNVAAIDSVVIGGVLIDGAARSDGFARMKRIAAAPSVGEKMVESFESDGLDAALATYERHCPASIEVIDCTGISAVEYGLAPALAESAEKARYGELVAWAERTFADQPEVQIWAALHHRSAGAQAAAQPALQRALALAPGDPFAMHQLRASQNGS